MKIAVIGAGSMGAGFVKALAGTHEVAVGSREPGRGRDLAGELGAALGDLNGKILVDVTNPYVDGVLRPHEDTSDSEEIQRMAPGTRVVKGWNTIFSQVLNDSADFGGQAASVFLAGDDEAAKSAVAALAEEMGYEPIDSGPLSSARKLERLVSMLGTLGRGLPRGSYTLKVLHR